MLTWIRRHADPDECLTVLIAVAFYVLSWAVWHDAVLGKARDAPFLRIDNEYRAVGWAGFATFALACLRLPRMCWARRLSQVLLIVMPGMRLGSYVVSWAASWDWLDKIVRDDWLVGDPRAAAAVGSWMLAIVPIVALWVAPWSWGYLDRGLARRGRLERKEHR